MKDASELTWLANNLTRRARECDPLTPQEMRQLALMLEAIRDGKDEDTENR